ncbi:DUF3558 family protein [Actinophytocola sp.]|uniref:DUF3558 family protein n=1 Tax=Actinophytocola sp. TaxID=1872138 RepID=UPI0025C6C762|nr:DUF3558 family protein [Actinophytocola sp.]
MVGFVLAWSVGSLGACTSSQAGTPTPAEPDSTSTSEPKETSSESDDQALDDVEPCELLSDIDVAEVGLEDGERLSDITCDWKLDIGTGVRLDLYRERSMDSNAEKGTPVDIGDHRGDRIEGPGGEPGVCAVAIEASDSSFVLVTANHGDDTSAACGLATDVAERVEQKLP